MINFDKIVPDIFVGTCPGNGMDVRRLAQAGITAVLNLQTDSDFRRLGIDWPGLEQHYATSGISPWRVPIVDFDRDDLVDKIAGAARVLGEMRGQGHRVYVHCTAGQERSPAVVIGYLAWHRDMGLEQALETVKGARQCQPFEDALERADRLYRSPD